MSHGTRTLLTVALVGLLGLPLTLPVDAQAGAGKAEVRWFQWKTTEVGDKLMNEVKAAFEKDNPDVTLTLVDNPFLGFHDKVINLFQAQKLADVVMAQVDWPVEFAELGILEPLDAFIAKEPKPFMDNIFPTFHKKWRGKQYYLPIETGPVALFYNTEIFKKAGIAGPPKTWDEYVAVAKKVTRPEQKIFATTGTMSAEPPTNLTYDLYPLIYQAGGDVIDETTNKAVFNSPAGVKAVQWYVDLMNVHKVSVPGILSSGEKEKRANFAAGNIAMMFEGSFGIPIQRQMNREPAVRRGAHAARDDHRDRGPRRRELHDHPGQNKEAAWKFMRWLHGPVGIEMWAKGSGSFPSRKDVAEQAWFKEKKLFQVFVQQLLLPNAKSPNLGMPNAVQLNKALTVEIQYVLQGKKGAKQALDDAAAEWNKVLAQYQK